jgi:hypothetical protein
MVAASRISAPAGLETFGEVMAAYQGYAMGASQRRCVMSFANDSRRKESASPRRAISAQRASSAHLARTPRCASRERIVRMCDDHAAYVRQQADRIFGCLQSSQKDYLRFASRRSEDIDVESLRKKLIFDDVDAGLTSASRSAAPMTPPGNCKTFAEVAWAYDNHAMGAARRRSSFAFAQQGIVPDNLQTVAQKAAALRSPRCSPNTSTGSPNPSIADQTLAIDYPTYTSQEVAVSSPKGRFMLQETKSFADTDYITQVTPTKNSKVALDFSIYSMQKNSNCAKNAAKGFASKPAASIDTKQESSMQRMSRARSQSRERYVFSRSACADRYSAISAGYTDDCVLSPRSLSPSRPMKERAVWERLAAKVDAGIVRKATPILAGPNEAASFGYR